MAKLIGFMILLLSFGAQAQMSCLELFSDKSISQDQLQIVAKELHGLRSEMLNAQDPKAATLAKAEFNKKTLELRSLVSAETIRDLIRNIESSKISRVKVNVNDIRRNDDVMKIYNDVELVSSRELPNGVVRKVIAVAPNITHRLLMDHEYQSEFTGQYKGIFELNNITTGEFVRLDVRGHIQSDYGRFNEGVAGFSRTGKYVYFVSKDLLEIFDMKGERVFKDKLNLSEAKHWQIKFSIDDNKIILRSFYDFFYVIDLKTKKLAKHKVENHIRDIEFLPGNERVFVGYQYHKGLRVYDLNSKTMQVLDLKWPETSLLTQFHINLTQDQMHIIIFHEGLSGRSNNFGKTIYKLSSRTLDTVLSFTLPDEVRVVQFSPDGTKLATHTGDPMFSAQQYLVFYSLVDGLPLSNLKTNTDTFRFINNDSIRTLEHNDFNPDKVETWEWK